MEDLGIDCLQSLYRERICFGQYTLGTVILVLPVDIFEIDRVTARHGGNLDSLLLQFIHDTHLRCTDSRNQGEVNVVEMFDGMCEIERSSSGHVHRLFGRYNLVECDMPYTAKFMHTLKNRFNLLSVHTIKLSKGRQNI